MTLEESASVLPKVHASVALKEAVEEADVVIEAVYEDLALKQEVFQELDRLSPERTILASTTSTLMPSKLATATGRPDKVLVAHYVNPPYLVPLVEMVRARQTSDETVTTIYDLLTKMGKRPVVVQSEVPGFISNRLQMSLAREALWLVQEGIASPEDVDTILTTSLGRRWAVAGVFEIFDAAGWDSISAAMSGLLPELERSPEVPPVLKEKVKRGELGVKTGRGFYEWTQESAEALRQRIAHALVEIEEWPR